MAKRPKLKTIEDGWYEDSDFNHNFDAIAEAFINALWRVARDGESKPETPNFMESDLDVSDANVTNVNQLYINSATVANKAFNGFGGERYVEKLAALSCNDGAIITHLNGDPICREPGTDGQVLKSDGSTVVWEEDLDTDTDTVGVTVQEDGVTVAENVTNIDFKWPGGTLITTPAGNQVDLELELLRGALFEDFTQADSNLDPSSSVLFNNVGEVTRVDLINDAGLASVPSTADEVYVVAEASNGFRDSGLAGGGLSAGEWFLDVRFYENDGTSTPLSGTEIPVAGTAVLGTSNGGNLLTLFRGVPADARYVDFAWSLIPTTPLFVNTTNFSDRFRAVINAAEYLTYATPQGHTTQGVRAKTTAV